MRETCARVLAAALMTGAIGFALAMPAFFGTTQDVGRSLTAPPSSLQRSVHLVASAPSRPARAGRLEGTHPVRRAVHVTVVPASSPHSTTSRQSKPSPKPAPTPAALAPDTRELANNTPAAPVSPPAPSRPAGSSGGGKGKGKGHDRDKKKGNAPQAEQPPVPATTPPPPKESPKAKGEKDHGHDKGKGHDKGREE